MIKAFVDHTDMHEMGLQVAKIDIFSFNVAIKLVLQTHLKKNTSSIIMSRNVILWSWE